MPKSSSTDRGYGYFHQRRRKAIAPVVDSGALHCSRCGQRIEAGQRWHLDHSDDRSGYIGVSHALCNLRAGGKRGAEIRNAERTFRIRRSREW